MRKSVALLTVFILSWACAPRYALNHDYPKEPISFPKDFAAHYDAQTEWWYYTGHLFDEERNEYGFELTFFKRITNDDRTPMLRLPAYWIKNVGLVGHFAVTDVNAGRFRFAQKVNLCSEGIASPDQYEVSIGDWSAGQKGGEHVLRARMKGYEIELELKPLKDPVPNGPGGIVAKGGGNGNYYYSITRIEVDGTLKAGGTASKVRGMAWMDHEYGTMKVSSGQKGWDWFSLQLSDGTDIMLYMIRNDNRIVNDSGGTLVYASGEYKWLKLSDFEVKATASWHSEKTGADYPSAWEICIKPLDMRLEVMPVMNDQEIRLPPIDYWEGAVNIKGERDGTPVLGKGYVELVGYSKTPKIGDSNLK